MSALDPFKAGPIAHRCLHDITDGRPENSWEALDASISRGLAVEIDLQYSRDGQAVVFHDYELARLTEESGSVRDWTAAELANIPLKHGKKTIPLFADFLAYADGRIPILVEIKDQDGALGDEESGIEAAVCRAAKQYSGPIALMSFNPHIIARCARIAPNIPRGLVTENFDPNVWQSSSKERLKHLTKIADYDAVGASFISHNVADLSSEHVAGVKAKGGAVFCWTVRGHDQEVEALKTADSITFENYIPIGVK